MHQDFSTSIKNDDLNGLLSKLDLEKLYSRQDYLSAEDSLYEFLKQAWPIIEGKTPFIDNWHIKAIAEHLEAVYERKIKKLIINVPPRTGKTNLISIAFPAWVWLHNPCERFLTASCVNSLSLEHAQKSRQLIESDWYQSNWGYQFPNLTNPSVGNLEGLWLKGHLALFS